MTELTYTPGPGSIAGRLTGDPVWTPEAGWVDAERAFPYPATWTRPTASALVIGGTGVNGRPRVSVDAQLVTVIGPVNLEPGMVRVRTADGQVHRALRENIAPGPTENDPDPWGAVLAEMGKA